jgi:SlyX protein
MSEERIDELEIRLAFQDDIIDALNTAVAEQDKRIQLLEEGMRELYQQVKERQSPEDDGIQPFDPSSEIPPHY